jgi:cell division protease FtsH
MNFQQMTSRLAIMMGGRVAEELIFGRDKVTSGASSDIDAATRLARNMVTRWGYSDVLGTVSYGDNQDEVFLGHSVARSQNVSEDTARLIDQEIRRFIEEAEATARDVLTNNLDELHRLAEGLLEYETLTGEEAKRAIKGEDIGREDQSKGRIVPLIAGGSSIPKTKPRKPGPFGDPAPQGA